jgi:hypothetical protein
MGMAIKIGVKISRPQKYGFLKINTTSCNHS